MGINLTGGGGGEGFTLNEKGLRNTFPEGTWLSSLKSTTDDLVSGINPAPFIGGDFATGVPANGDAAVLNGTEIHMPATVTALGFSGWNNTDLLFPEDRGSAHVVYDTETGEWELKSFVGTPQSAGAVASVGGTLYLLGGAAWNVFVDPDTGVFTYSWTEANGWVRQADKPSSTFRTKGNEINGTIYVPGGRNIDSFAATDVLEAYTPSEDSWESLSLLSIAKDAYASIVVDGEIYLFGGENNAQNAITQAEKYIPDEDTWELLAPMPTAVSRAGVFHDEANGELIIFGGQSAPGNDQGITQMYENIMVYSIEDDTYEERTNVPVDPVLYPPYAEVDGVGYSFGMSDTTFVVSGRTPKYNAYIGGLEE